MKTSDKIQENKDSSNSIKKSMNSKTQKTKSNSQKKVQSQSQKNENKFTNNTLQENFTKKTVEIDAKSEYRRLKQLEKNQRLEQKIQKREMQKNIKQKKFSVKLTLKIISFVLYTALIFGIFYFVWTKFSNPKTESTRMTIENQLSLCQELVTAKYRYTDIVSIKKFLGFSKSYSIVRYSGLLRAGIYDITQSTYKISSDQKTLNLYIPHAEILGNEITKQDVFDEKQSIFVPISTQEIFDEIERSKSQTQEDIVLEGFLNEADNYAKRILEFTFKSAGFENVNIDFLNTTTTENQENSYSE